jgi:hypothetical protein
MRRRGDRLLIACRLLLRAKAAVEVLLRSPMRVGLNVHEIAVGQLTPGELKGFVDIQDVAGDVVEPPPPGRPRYRR